MAPQTITITNLFTSIRKTAAALLTLAAFTPGFSALQAANADLLATTSSTAERQALAGRLDYIDRVYGTLPRRLKDGRGIVIFLDPAHGMLKNGMSQSIKTNRTSNRNLTEEYYSLQIARQLYAEFKKNPNFRLVTTDSLQKALDKKSALYDNIGFDETISLARSHEAALIVSEHLNNTSLARRHNGALKKGIFVTRDDKGKKMLVHNRDLHEGFLTLYNPYDTLNLSFNTAFYTRKYLQSSFFKTNGWGQGLVADRRFSYFNEFPASVIFESGFICTPSDERKLYSRQGQRMLGRAHYRAIVDSFSRLLGVDLHKKVSPSASFNTSRLHSRINSLKHIRAGMFHLLKGRVELSNRLMQKGLAASQLTDRNREDIRGLQKKLTRIAANINRSQAITPHGSALRDKITHLKKALRECQFYSLNTVKYILNRRIRKHRRELSEFVRATAPPAAAVAGSELEEQRNRRSLNRLNARPYLVLKYRADSWQKAVRAAMGSEVYNRAGSAAVKELTAKYNRGKDAGYGIFLVYISHDKNFAVKRVSRRTLVELDGEQYHSQHFFANTSDVYELVQSLLKALTAAG